MSLEALLAARAHAEGRAQPTALLRHRAIADDRFFRDACDVAACFLRFAISTFLSGRTL
jgi:hypothetical protein